jgi:hypothetical protein
VEQKMARRNKKNKKSDVEESKIITIYKHINKIIAVFIAVIGLFVSHLTLKPKISVEPDIQIESNNPFTTTFKISNNGYLPVNNVEISHWFNNVIFSKPKGIMKDSKLTTYGNMIPILGVGQTETAFRLSAPVIGDIIIAQADIAITISYKAYWPPPWHLSENFAFTLTKNSSGSQYWQHTILH